MPAKKSQILIIEDDPSIVSILKNKFQAEDFQVKVANDGLTGLKAALEIQPDLILLDIIMPVMDGLTMLAKLRASGDFGQRVPVVILTNLSEAEKVQAAASHGVYDFLVKANWDLEDLINLVRSKLGKK